MSALETDRGDLQYEGNPGNNGAHEVLMRVTSVYPVSSATAPADLYESSPRAEGRVVQTLCVDLDGTLIATDVLWESTLSLVKSKPAAVFALPFWLLKGKAYFKRMIAEHVQLDASLLPYRQDLLLFLKQQKESGRRLVLATASDRKAIQPIVNHLNLFHEVIASDGVNNLSGKNKCKVLEARFGHRQFDYVGNARADIPSWRAANIAHLVAPSPRVLRSARSAASVRQVFAARRNRAGAVLKALRVHQWAKNALLLLPLITAHRLFDGGLVLDALCAFMVFNLCASGVYVLNDLLDLESDRQHPKKRLRPFAAGSLSIATGLILLPFLLVSAFVLALMTLPYLFSALLAVYLVTTTAYSLQLKKFIIVDVIVLAGLYTLRVLAGGVAVSIVVSTWLLALSIFLFLSLAFMKRYAELRVLKAQQRESATGRDYLSSDLEWLGSMGTSSGYISVLVLALYISSKDVEVLYSHPRVLWLICPFLLYWIARMWARAYRGQLDDDPIVVAATDRGSYAVGVIIAMIIIAAL